MICEACGATVPDDSEFCNKCGRKLSEDKDEEREKTPVERLAAEEEKEDDRERDLWEGRLSWKAYGIWFLLLILLGVVQVDSPGEGKVPGLRRDRGNGRSEKHGQGHGQAEDKEPRVKPPAWRNAPLFEPLGPFCHRIPFPKVRIDHSAGP